MSSSVGHLCLKFSLYSGKIDSSIIFFILHTLGHKSLEHVVANSKISDTILSRCRKYIVAISHTHNNHTINLVLFLATCRGEKKTDCSLCIVCVLWGDWICRPDVHTKRLLAAICGVVCAGLSGSVVRFRNIVMQLVSLIIFKEMPCMVKSKSCLPVGMLLRSHTSITALRDKLH